MRAHRAKIYSILLLAQIILFVCAVPAALAAPAKPPLVAVVLSSKAKPYIESLAGFYAALGRKGVDYEAVEFDMTASSGGVMASRIRELDPDVIHAVGTSAAALARDEFRETPVVFSMALNPVDSNLVKSLARPGGNVTGASLDIPYSVQLAEVRRLAPRARRIGVIYSEAETAGSVAAIEKAAAAAGHVVVKRKVSSAEEVPRALDALTGQVDVLWSVADGVVFNKQTLREFLAVTLDERIPFVGLSSSYVRAGALAAFEADPLEVGGEAARITRLVLGGEAPGAIPVAAPRKAKLFINANTAKAIKLRIPDELYNSSEVISP